jgi:Cytochrome c554 and c-prime
MHGARRSRARVYTFLVAYGLLCAGPVACALKMASGPETAGRVSVPRMATEPVAPASLSVPNPHAASGGKLRTEIIRGQSPVTQQAVDEAHAACFVNDPFPSAKKCRECHPQHYREWSVSPHAYAQISPVFNAMSNKLIELNNGTLGDFCIRCHTPVGMALDEPINTSNSCRKPTSREGVTCVVCHRINQAWGKGAGRLALVQGDIHAPVYGPIGSSILEEVLANPDRYGVLKTRPDPDVRGRDVHAKSERFFYITTSAMCGACHDVFAPNGFRLEDAFSEYKSSPAAKVERISCQDCHMGKVPGENRGYHYGPVAHVGNVDTPSRKRTNHMIVGPDYSIVHPGIYPHNPEAVRDEGDDPLTAGLATFDEWLLFNHRAGWGTDAFEKTVPKGAAFPKPWDTVEMRRKGRKIINDQKKLLAEADLARHRILSTGYRLGDIETIRADCDKGIKFRICVSNGTNGHGVPTGFDAERLVFLRVIVFDRDGKVVYQSGDLDANGDIRDSHSYYVHNGLIPLDRQLFTLQTRFITRNFRGGEREQVLNVPYSLDPLPYTRPEIMPFTILGRPVGARKQKQNLEICGHRWATYEIQPRQLCGTGPYTARVQLIAGMVPVNLVQEISSVGFDYGMSAREVAAEVVRGHMVLHTRTALFNLK